MMGVENSFELEFLYSSEFLTFTGHCWDNDEQVINGYRQRLRPGGCRLLFKYNPSIAVEACFLNCLASSTTKIV